MLHIEDVLQLKEGEKVRFLTRRHLVTIVPKLLLSMLLIVIPFFLLFPLFALGLAGVFVFAAMVIAGIVLAVRTFILWDADVLIVTTFRLVDVDQRGIFSRMVSEAPLTAIQDVSWSRKGVLETMFRMGALVIQTASSTNTIEAPKIPYPEYVHEMINDLRHATRPQKKNVDPEREEKLQAIGKLLERFSDEELERIETILRARERKAVADAFLENDEPAEKEHADEPPVEEADASGDEVKPA
jgi:membrane protein YdbS with pleckstrin-like domain